MRFSYCGRDAWEKMESAFRGMMSGKCSRDFSDFSGMLRYVGVWYDNRPNAIRVFIKDYRNVSDWTDISDLFLIIFRILKHIKFIWLGTFDSGKARYGN